MPTPRGRPEAIVRPQAIDRAFTVERVAPSPDVAEFVDYHWLVRWHLDRPHTQQVVPQPRVHLVAEHAPAQPRPDAPGTPPAQPHAPGRLLVHGVTRRRFSRRLVGTAHALGTAFHPAGFRPVLGGSVGALADTVRPAGDVLGVDDVPVARHILAAADPGTMVAAMERYLRSLRPEPDPTAREVSSWVHLAEQRTDITRAAQLADAVGVSLRTLQRLCADYIGIGPKWVIQRFRILEAAAAAHAGAVTDWAALAHTLGFSDQAHLTRVFTEVIGTPPATYQREAGGG